MILLKARTEAGAEMLSEILAENDIAHERLGPIGVVLRSTLEEKAVLGIRETLRAAGLFLE